MVPCFFYSVGIQDSLQRGLRHTVGKDAHDGSLTAWEFRTRFREDCDGKLKDEAGRESALEWEFRTRFREDCDRHLPLIFFTTILYSTQVGIQDSLQRGLRLVGCSDGLQDAE